MNPETKRILIVDDTPENIQVLGSVLRKHQYLINVAQNGQQALDAVAKVKPDLILLDVMMPVMDGFEACRRLKADPETADIPVIFLTARIESDDVVKGLEIGGVDYIGKPFNAPELMQRIRTHLTIRELQTSLEQRVIERDQAAKTISIMAREHQAFLRHELNNALAPILGYADMLIHGPSQDESKRTQWAEKIHSNVMAVSEMLNALRDLHALERGTHEINRDEIDLISLITEELHALQVSFPGVVIPVEIRKDRALVTGDSGLLPGVFRNLIKNAVEHVQDLPVEERGLSLELTGNEGMIDILICNGGAPIPPHRIEHFFEKFNSTKEGKGGTGLGTSYAFAVVTAHGGDIEVTSTADEGTCVRVRLPSS